MRKYLSKGIVLIYIFSTVFFCNSMVNQQEKIEEGQDDIGFKMTATDFGVMCINTAYPSMQIELTDSRDNEADYSGENIEILENAIVEDEKQEIEPGEPRVLIIHTHATESYLPSSEGNFHRKDEENTVRDVGNVLEETLESQGIGVVHDKTLHDYPSYNDSYARSYETAANLMRQYPTVECVIDLHRDAVSSSSPAATISVLGNNCAKYSYVIGTSPSTYSQNKAFVNKLNTIAATNYNGFTGTVIERGYEYNQSLSSKYLLLEIGFNRNQIEDCRNTARIFGNVLAQGLKEGR